MKKIIKEITPVKKSDNKEKAKKKVILYSYEELDLFVKALENLEDKELQMAIYTSLNTGARRGEVMALTFEDINTERCSIDFNKAKITTNGTEIKDIKNGKNRQFYVSKNYINLVNKYYKYLGKPKKNTPMFTMHPDTYSDKFKEFLSNNNLRKINLKFKKKRLTNQGGFYCLFPFNFKKYINYGT